MREGGIDGKEHHTVHIEDDSVYLPEKRSGGQKGSADTDDIDAYAPEKSQDTLLTGRFKKTEIC